MRWLIVLLAALLWAAPASAVDLRTYSGYAWKAAVSLSGAEPQTVGRLQQPVVVVYPMLRLRDEGFGEFDRICGEIVALDVVPEGANRYRTIWIAYIFTYPSETRLMYETMIHEFLHYISFEMLVDDPAMRFAYLGGSEEWVKRHFPQGRCTWPIP